MPGFELINSLAALEEKLAEKLEETRRSADQRIKNAEAESERLLAEAEAEIRRMEEVSRTRITDYRIELAEDARHRAAAEKTRLLNQALPNIPRAVAFILSEIIP